MEGSNQYNLIDLHYRVADQPAAAYQTQNPNFLCPSRPQAVLSIGDFATPGGALTDYAASFGTAALYTSSTGAIIPAIPVQITTDSNGKPYLNKWKAQIRFADLTDGTSNTTIFGEKHIRPNSLRGKNEDRSAYSAVRNTHRRMMGTYTDGTTTEIRPLLPLQLRHPPWRTRASVAPTRYLPIRLRRRQRSIALNHNRHRCTNQICHTQRWRCC